MIDINVKFVICAASVFFICFLLYRLSIDRHDKAFRFGDRPTMIIIVILLIIAIYGGIYWW